MFEEGLGCIREKKGVMQMMRGEGGREGRRERKKQTWREV